MTLRVAMLTDPSDRRRAALFDALRGGAAKVELRAMRPAGGRGASLARLPFGPVLDLAAYRPDLIVSEDFGASALQAAVYRSLSRRPRVLLCATEPPRRLGSRERLILRRADGVLAEGDGVAQAVARLGVPASRVFPLSAPYDGVGAFLACGRTRSGPKAHRLVYAGDLSPRSGAADLLISVAAWAERNPGRPVEIWWIGDGDLARVLGAQPLPDTVPQRFLGRLDPPGMAAAFAQCGLLVVPSPTDEAQAPVAEALAAGLLVLGSRRSRDVKRLVREGVNGWTFDPLRPESMARALDLALDSPAERLDRMRDAARALVCASAPPSVAGRLREVISALMPGVAFDPSPRPAR